MNSRIDQYVLGAMTPEERAAMDVARLHDKDLDRAITEAEERLAPLSLAAGEGVAPRGLWSRIENALDEETRAMSGRVLERMDEGTWEEMVEGVDFKILWGTTRILRCKPGALLPCHHHDAQEHLIVLSGDLVIGGRSFGPGDYIRSPQGDDKFLHTTRTGCLLLQQIAA